MAVYKYLKVKGSSNPVLYQSAGFVEFHNYDSTKYEEVEGYPPAGALSEIKYAKQQIEALGDALIQEFDAATSEQKARNMHLYLAVERRLFDGDVDGAKAVVEHSNIDSTDKQLQQNLLAKFT